MRRARLLAILCCAVPALLAPVAARADGDPASDVLLGQRAYYPYPPNAVATELEKALDAMLAAAEAKGFELKVALIAAPADLGAVPQLFTDPQGYADLLTSELAFNTKPRVLVVLPGGMGGNNLGNGAAALGEVTVDAAAGADGLARAAMLAAGRLTQANGTPVPVPAVARERGRSGGGREDGDGPSPLLIFGLPVLLVAVGAAVAAWRGRGHENVEDDADAGPDTNPGDGAEPGAGAAGTPPPAQ